MVLQATVTGYKLRGEAIRANGIQGPELAVGGGFGGGGDFQFGGVGFEGVDAAGQDFSSADEGLDYGAVEEETQGGMGPGEAGERELLVAAADLLFICVDD